ncbi:MAG TPA: hypothetical protein VLE48_03530 [Terriglobales bacterium]|nr:hypothetical protein [Terriglobales bacterium]
MRKSSVWITLLLVLGVCCLLPAAAPAQDELFVMKDSLQIKAHRGAALKGARATWWPEVAFTVRGSIPSGGQFEVSFGYPAKRQWLKFDCESPSQAFGKEDQWKVFCALGPDGVGTYYVGPVDFTINLRNPLTETNTVLYKGKFKAALEPGYSDEAFYVDDDWRFPIGYVYFREFLTTRFWVRGVPAVQAFLFYQGKEIAKTSQGGNDNPADAARYQWGYTEISFSGVYPKKVPDYAADAPNFVVPENPGEYEIKVLLYRQLARSIKFTVLPDGTIDNSIATANHLGIDDALVPVRVIGTSTRWNKLAWKTDTFYAHPLTGFTAPP